MLIGAEIAGGNLRTFRKDKKDKKDKKIKMEKKLERIVCLDSFCGI